MLYMEFLSGTKANKNSRTYGKQEKINHDRLLKSIRDMREYCDADGVTPEQMKTRRLMHHFTLHRAEEAL